MADPFDVLESHSDPVAPRAEFAASLRRRLEEALRPPPPTPTTAARTQLSSNRTIGAASATTTPYLCVHDAAAAIDFYVAAFGAVEMMRLPQPAPDARLGHAEITVGGSRIMLSDEFPELGVLSARTLGGSPLMLHVTYQGVDIDAVFAQAERAGATVIRPPADQFYGERAGQLVDPFGHRWTLATVVEELSDEEIARRAPGGSGAEQAEASDGAVTAGRAEVAPVDLGRRAPTPPAPTSGREGDLGYLTLGVPDLQRAKAFFGALLGWRFEEDVTSDGRSSSHVGNVDPPLGVVGGEAPPRSTLYFRVGDIREAAARAVDLGGEAGEPTLHPSGWNVGCVDDQGLRFDLWQPADGY